MISRDPAKAATDSYDLIIIGGGIYGAMLAVEASRRKLHPLLLEKDDFGQHTSFNSLRIVHGGLRYLQSLDLHRFRESVSERRWFLKTFPGLVKPLPCLMPLYGNGLHRPSIFRLALLANELLSSKRNRGVQPSQHLPPGKLIDADQTRETFPLVDMQGLKGAAVWQDAIMPDSQRLLIEILHWACAYGATALNYVEACQLLKTQNSVAGVGAINHVSGESYEYRAKVVVNAAGPWCRQVAQSLDCDKPTLFQASIGWNILLNKKAVSDYAVAIVPRRRGAQTYFLVPWKGMLIAGTGQASWSRGQEKPVPSKDLMDRFLEDLNLALPALNARKEDILRVFAGLLPAEKAGSAELANREVILSHDNHGGPRGLYSISGVKFTTARRVAEKTLNRIFPDRRVPDIEETEFSPLQSASEGRGIYDFDWYAEIKDPTYKEALSSIIAEEAVQHLDDLILRRTTLWENASRALKVTPLLSDLFEWDHSRRSKEIERAVQKILDGCNYQLS